jgi:hypothetical protein
MTPNQTALVAVLTEKLSRRVLRNPSSYAYGVDGVPAHALKMANGLVDGSTFVTPAIRQTARQLGIQTNMRCLVGFWHVPADARATHEVDAGGESYRFHLPESLRAMFGPAVGTVKLEEIVGMGKDQHGKALVW